MPVPLSDTLTGVLLVLECSDSLPYTIRVELLEVWPCDPALGNFNHVQSTYNPEFLNPCTEFLKPCTKSL